ncbi:hypothetical protein HYALB_00012445 [Hymenoscyphus albidus]|uniref:Uncharacterized protein n=1 Tax=Hymenoscyphus albidus TaxID=595503 RepID=A0A9N9Q9G3_9HELO|nr:hypothetical protein HYALB_00012445 [Hymenoscyphus albidus]
MSTPTTQDSTTQDSTTQDSTTQDSTTQDSTTQDSTTQDSTTQDSTTQDSTTQDSTTQDSTTQDSTTQDSTTQDSTVQNSTNKENPTTKTPNPRQTMVEIAKNPDFSICGKIERAKSLLEQKGDSYKRWKENLNPDPENKGSTVVTKAIEIKETTELRLYLTSLEKKRLTVDDRGTWGGNN